MRKKIPLDKDEAVVAFDLKDGRRKESLREQQVANAAAGQLAVEPADSRPSNSPRRSIRR